MKRQEAEDELYFWVAGIVKSGVSRFTPGELDELEAILRKFQAIEEEQATAPPAPRPVSFRALTLTDKLILWFRDIMTRPEITAQFRDRERDEAILILDDLINGQGGPNHVRYPRASQN